MEREATFQYQILRVPDKEAANCVYVNGTLMHRSDDEFADSAKVFSELNCAKRDVNISELAKAGGAMSSSSILIRKPRYIKHL